MDKLTAEQTVTVTRLVKNIDKVLMRDEKDGQMVLAALFFYMVGVAKNYEDLGDREAVEYCADFFKHYAQFVFS
jgi:hypothetical protein